MEPIAQRVSLPPFVKDMTALLDFAESKEGRKWLKKANAVMAELNERIAVVGQVDDIHKLRLGALNDRAAAMTERNEAKETAEALLASINVKGKEADARSAKLDTDLESREHTFAMLVKTSETAIAEREKAIEVREAAVTKAKQKAEAAQASAEVVKEEYERRAAVLAGRLKAARAA